MKVTFGNYTRCIKNFKPMKIVPKVSEQQGLNKYFVFDSDNVIGVFSYNKGYITDLALFEHVRRTKKAADAILSIKDFIIKKAKEQGLDHIYFEVLQHKDALSRMYKKLGATFAIEDPAMQHFVGILNPKNKEQIIAKYKLPKVEFKMQSDWILPA